MEETEMKRRRAAVREDHGDKMDDKLQQQRNTEERPAAALPRRFHKSHVTSALLAPASLFSIRTCSR